MLKVYLGIKKEGNKYLQGMTVYSNIGEVLYNTVGILRPSSNQKFMKDLDVLLWGIKKLQVLIQNGELPYDEDIILFVDSKTVYKWFVQEKAPKSYIIKFSEILMELAFFTNNIEIIYTDRPRVLFKKQEEELIGVRDLFNSLMGEEKEEIGV